MQEEIIKKHFDAANAITISQMYLNSFPDREAITPDNIKKYNPGHLGTSMGINFILANLNYYLNHKNLRSQLVIGTGHSGVSLLANLWLNGTLEKYYPNYQRNRHGLDNLIKDFGSKIRSEINPEYPETIYDGGELGYSLGVAYGYAINSDTDIVPCIIGDGEAETGTIASAWKLAKLLKTKSKVLPIINLNGLKMGSSSYLSTMADEQLKMFFSNLGYQVIIVSSSNNVIDTIKIMQAALNETNKYLHPLIIFKASKGYTLSKYEGTTSVHKNPLQNADNDTKATIIKSLLSSYDLNIFDSAGNILPLFDNFKTIPSHNRQRRILEVTNDNDDIAEYLSKLLKENSGLIFSPDEIYSNKFEKCSPYAVEILNENLLQALYQGYIQAGNHGYYIAYEGFMPIISSMITQYYKYLKQKNATSNNETKNSLNYILTSTCWENTYSHQNPDFVNALLEKKDDYYNVVYPKDKYSAIKNLQEFHQTSDKINVMTISKRHSMSYPYTNNCIETIVDCENPELILSVTGDYMLDTAMQVVKNAPEKQIKVVYVTKPQILNINNQDALSTEEFSKYFNPNIPVIYLYCGYASTIKSLLFDRNISCHVMGYEDGISIFGNLNNNLVNNNISVDDILKICDKRIKVRSLRRDIIEK